MKDGKTEVTGKSKNPPHGVTFRMEIDSMRQTIMAHMEDYEGLVEHHIEAAIADCMSSVGAEIAAAVDREVRVQVDDMVRSRVHDVVWNEKFGDSLKEMVREKLNAEFS